MLASSNVSSNINRSSNEQKLVRAACANCHARKVRCDAHKRGFPCSNCITSQRSNCRKHEKRKRPYVRSAGNLIPLRQRSQDQLPPTHHSAQKTTSRDTAETPILAAPTSISSGSGNHLVEFLDQRDIQNRSVLRGSRMTYVGKDVSNINFLVRQREGEEKETVYHLSSDEIASHFNPHQGDRIPIEALMLPDQDLANQLVQAYFTHVNSWFPIVDEETFLGQYRRKDPEDPPSLLLLQAILLVGAHVSQEQPDRDTLKETFFRRAKMLYDGRLEKNRDFVVQSALLLTWYSDGAEDVGANAWHWIGIAARTALGIGMHRDMSSPSRFTHPDGHTFRRIWWILVQFDVTIALSYGRPQALNLDECDVKYLAATDFQGCGPNVKIQYVIKRTELCILISKILRERFGLRVSKEDRKAALGNADETLANWCLQLPQSLQMGSSELSVWTSSLHLTYSNFLILLHRPHPKASKGSEEYGPNDSDICGTAANAITSIFESLRSRGMIKYLWISDINALFTAMVQVSVELRFSNPVLAINALRRFDSSLLSLRRLAEYWVNADSILRIFEESSHIQHGIRLGHVRESEKSQSEDGSRTDQIMVPNTSDERLEIQSTWDGTFIPPAVVPTARDTKSMATNYDLQDATAWRNLFPTGDTPEEFLLSTDIPFDSEWREIYWQEPGISSSFGDGVWGWP